MVLLDMMNIVFIEYHMTKRVLKEQEREFDKENLPFFYHNFFTFFNKIVREYNNIVVCWEGERSLDWRREIYPDYKRNRDEKKAEDDYKILISTIPVIQDALSGFPVKQLSVKGAEADDVIFVLSTFYKKGHTIISTDKDLTQILAINPNVTIYNPIKKTVAKYHPYLVEEKAIVGDKSDNIGGLYRVGIKTFEKMMEDRALFNKVMSKGNNKEIYKQLLKIIDLRNIPKDLQEKIIDEEKKIDYNKLDNQKIEEFYFEHKLKELLMR